MKDSVHGVIVKITGLSGIRSNPLEVLVSFQAGQALIVDTLYAVIRSRAAVYREKFLLDVAGTIDPYSHELCKSFTASASLKGHGGSG
jgi:hypothetical protein